MIKLIAMDMDGTLLTQNNEILPKTKEVLMALQRKGIRLVLASGRSYSRLMKHALELEMDRYGGYLVEINGSAIYDVQQGKRERLSQMEVPQIHELFHYFMKWNVEILSHLDDGMYDYMSEAIYQEKAEYRKVHNLPDDFPWTPGPFELLYDNRQGYPRHFHIQTPEEIQECANKISVTYHEDVIANVMEQARKDLKGRYWVGLTTPRWIEVMPLGVSKAHGLKIVGERLGIKVEEMMAFGDGENDMEMIAFVGMGVAMKNAFAGLKEIAKEVCESNEEEGVAKTLQRHFDL
ncbi:Cof-type HAD-IIB family hydrolase [Amedibacillus sp. YH-ame6]